MTRATGRQRAALLFALLVLLLVGCGSEDEPRASAPSPPTDGGEEQPAEQAVALRGGERLLFFGDSLSVQGEPTFAERLPGAVEPEAPEVRVDNISVPGTTSSDWRPGSELFERELEPRLARSDVVLVSLGGNDLQAALGGVGGLDAVARADTAAAVPDLRKALRRIRRNLAATFDAIRKESAATAIVYVGYPDYSRSQVWRDAAGGIGTIALRVGLGELLEASRAARPDLAVDMLAATRSADVDALLADAEHLSARGHQLYATEISAALTG